MLTIPWAFIWTSLGISFSDNTVMFGNTISTSFLNGALIFGETKSIVVLLLKWIPSVVLCILENILLVVSGSIAG